MNTTSSCACGILFCYNEEHIIRDTLKHYLSQGIDLVIIDNCSTDSSMDIVKSFQLKEKQYSGKIKDVKRIETKGYEWRKILKFACEYMHKSLNHYEWMLLIDADAFYCSPVKDMSLLEFMKFIKGYNYNIINGKLYEFYPTDKDDQEIASPIERIKYFKVIDNWNQQKIFLYHSSIDFYSKTSGHVCYRDDSRVYSEIKFIYKHYPWTSYEQGIKKVFKERKPRYIERKDDPQMHARWGQMLPLEKDFIKQSYALKFYREEAVLLSSFFVFLIMKSRFLRFFRNKFNHYMRKSVKLLVQVIKKIVVLVMPLPIYRKIRSFILSIKFLEKPLKIFSQQNPQALTFPSTYHFLMTNYCNAQCIFCNQINNQKVKKEITLEKFKVMISNIPINSAKVFYFSGGGDPLLNRDLFLIIEYVNLTFPRIEIRIRTNGLLIEKFAETLAKLNISRLEISIQGQEEVNDFMLQRKGTEVIFKGITLLNKYLVFYNKKMHKTFYTTVSKINIEEVPKLIKKSTELKINEVVVSFFCYYPNDSQRNEKFRVEDSLFYHNELYDRIIRRSKIIAKLQGIYFRYEQLFSKGQEIKPCFQPWQVVNIDWNGEIYPCCGGEVQFQEKVKAGKYYFGNLLKEHLHLCWNSDSYVTIRRTINSNFTENFVPECKACQSCFYFKKPLTK